MNQQPTTRRLSAGATDFVATANLDVLLKQPQPDTVQVRDILAKSLAKEALTAAETAILIHADDPDSVAAVFDAANSLKREVYGNRIVLFAPLYIGNHCVNNCAYCGFKVTNTKAIRRTLSAADVEQQVTFLENQGHKRLILVFGEHPDYTPEFIADNVRRIYDIKSGPGEIRRVNINAAPLDGAGYRTVKSSGIGTYQIFQETYHLPTYQAMHPAGTLKGDYLYRLDGLSRAFEAGCDDMGVGALFGLYDWRYEVLALVTHSLFLQARYGVGPHTISFPRLCPASGVDLTTPYSVTDRDFMRLIAILRLAVPYTGLILTAREGAAIRREAMEYGVSQIDAGSRIEIGGYTEVGDMQVMEREQFSLGDIRSLDAVIRELLEDGYVPSFCTACYRLGRTGKQFMEFAIPGFIGSYCTPNAMTTLAEYLADYASPPTRAAGMQRLRAELDAMPDNQCKTEVSERLHRILECGEHDLYV